MKKFNLRELMQKAWMLVKNYGFTMADAMHQMWQVMKLKKRMSKGVVKFMYTKLDGSVRTAWGTLCESMMPTTEGTGRKQNDTVTTYWDCEKQAFRCFKTANFLRIA